MEIEATGTLQHPSPYDGIVKLRKDEPYVALLGRDPLAGPLAIEWAARRRKVLFADTSLTQEELEAELRQCTEAEIIGWAMMAYCRGEPTESVEPKQGKAGYSGHELPADALERKNKQRSLTEGSRFLSGFVADATTLAETLTRYGYSDIATRLMDDVIPVVRDLGEAIQPKRPTPGSPE